MAKNLYLSFQEGLIKSLIADPSALNDVVRIVDVNDFSDTNYQLVYEGLLNLNRANEEISLPGIVKMITEKNPEAHIDPEWILNLDNDFTETISQASATTWARLLKRESARAQTSKVINDAKQKLNKNNNPLDVISNINNQLNEIMLNSVEDNDKTPEEVIADYKEFMKERLTKKTEIIPSPYPSVDKYTIGWLPGQLITIAARTSVGKTVFATNAAVAAAAAGKSVQIFSLEMGEYDLIDRMTSYMSHIPLKTIKTEPFDMNQAKLFENTLKTYEQYKINIDPNPRVTVDYIRSKAIKRAQSEDGLDLIIVDYLQLITNPNHTGNRQESVAEVSREMKILAKQLGVPVIILAQVNRLKSDDDENKMPTINDIRESAAIAQDSDVIILIHRNTKSDDVDPKAKFIIGKNRNGEAPKIVTVRAMLECNTFMDMGGTEDIDGGNDSNNPDDTFVPDDSDEQFFSHTENNDQVEEGF